MADLTGLLEKRAQEESANSLSGGGTPEIVHGVTAEQAEIGFSAPVPEEKKRGDVNLTNAHMRTEDMVENEDKESDYDDTVERNPDTGPGVKAASVIAKRLLGKIDRLLKTANTAVTPGMTKAKQQEKERELAKLAGRKVAKDYLAMLEKSAEEEVTSTSGPSEATKEGIAERVGETEEGLTPDQKVETIEEMAHYLDNADNESPEIGPGQPEFKKAEEGAPGKEPQEIEATAALMVRKAYLYDELEKAAESGDPMAVAVAKAKIVDFLKEI